MGRSIATVQQARSAISHLHAAAILKGDNHARHPVVAEADKDCRNWAPTPRQTKTLTTYGLTRVREVLRLLGTAVRGGERLVDWEMCCL